MDGFDEFAQFDDAILEAMFADEEGDPNGAISGASGAGEQLQHDFVSGGDVPSTSTAQPAEIGTDTAQKQQRKKKAIPRPKSTYTAEKMIEEGVSLLLDTVSDISEDQFICEPALPDTPPVKSFADMCRSKISAGCDTVAATLLKFNIVLHLLWPAIHVADKHSTGTARKDASYTAWFKLRVEKQLEQAVNVTFETLTGVTDVPNMFTQMVIRIIHEKLLIKHEQTSKGDSELITKQLASKEQNALRYVCGYIAARLPRKVARHEHKVGFMEVVNNMKKDSTKDTRLNYTREWAEARSRGGLTMVNDMTFLFFQEVERCVRTHFPTTIEHLINVDIRVKVAEFALNDRIIIGKWTHITASASLSEHARLILLQLVIDFYIQIRGFSFARNIVERYKIKTKAQKSKGVRKTLKRTHEEASEK